MGTYIGISIGVHFLGAVFSSCLSCAMASGMRTRFATPRPWPAPRPARKTSSAATSLSPGQRQRDLIHKGIWYPPPISLFNLS